MTVLGFVYAQLELEPPPHEPTVLPRWLHRLGVEVIIARGMRKRARGLLEEENIKVITGAIGGDPEQVVEQYLTKTLVTGENLCDQ